ncbi:pyridoxal 5'-phosphate synthase glutaminase subunit PdxT [Bifidobacterium tibiigranuli]|jgi:5'-phosphate synthase pdxT subunit|uniref:pyridoxal 5'-phosphate synthase glutaminase subunit PdxT n=1 Tax=Bifidobacterium tibiigranuli TaxID=2172043 RepID=UPI0026EC29AA|nr:pyridoxal 5'-phosphate synthase glutaminase subunit PdxT [Bifidobacterium tibiigranuli]MCI1649034.1 glutamine amidotransferase subunit PdxT [Bifidobacterium tibiigranuli]MCI1673201.1 glutamine amidotransferase subunit PdxT [Bifidobacterium tibiigranuli]MCI1713554.1 glutamine amidotransferase subunit PdxT [Bifidobacterium tibiigranuli]MCI1833902.1 glutamine amidotransferase subunit PdxT [Bifidobacterium tibiigranuli]MCI2186269.1 glutamine amidotransferase subunit PdxT [Bifidobacterium tibiig
MVVAAQYIGKRSSGDQSRSVTGILAVQGAFAEHAEMLDRLGAPWRLLHSAKDWDDSIARVILPGGESTVQGRLLRLTGLFAPIAEHIAQGRPVLGTCAGMILLARKIENEGAADTAPQDAALGADVNTDTTHSDTARNDTGCNDTASSGSAHRHAVHESTTYFGALDAVVRRNAYGRQLGSFETIGSFGDIHDLPLVFIRGPYVTEVGPNATVESQVDGHVVGLRQGSLLATAFHPELTDDTRVHELLLSL